MWVVREMWPLRAPSSLLWQGGEIALLHSALLHLFRCPPLLCQLGHSQTQLHPSPDASFLHASARLIITAPNSPRLSLSSQKWCCAVTMPPFGLCACPSLHKTYGHAAPPYPSCATGGFGCNTQTPSSLLLGISCLSPWQAN